MDRKTNARWGIQFIWPIKGDFRIIYLDHDYQLTVIGRATRLCPGNVAQAGFQ
jgi:apolipoprotein D and lipocalin family protein